MKVVETELAGVCVIEPDVHGDARGYFLESFQSERYAELGVGPLVQLNHSHSRRGILRGLHFQQPKAQGKLVWTLSGAIFDVVADIRPGSPTCGRWVGVVLDAAEHKQLWVPPGYVHGFCVTSDEADVFYGCTELYAPDCEHAVAYDDPELAIDWPDLEPLLSERDRAAPRVADARVLPSL